MRASKWQLFGLMTATAFALAACAGEVEDDGMDMDQPAAEQPAPAPGGAQAGGQEGSEGRTVFTGAGNCFTCHGQDATGTALAPDLTDDTWINLEDPSVESVAQLVRTGVPQPVEHQAPMPPMGGGNLNDQQIQAVAEYVMSLAGSGM